MNCLHIHTIANISAPVSNHTETVTRIYTIRLPVLICLKFSHAESHYATYSASQKSTPPQTKLVCNIFTLAKYISIANLLSIYIHVYLPILADLS